VGWRRPEHECLEALMAPFFFFWQVLYYYSETFPVPAARLKSGEGIKESGVKGVVVASILQFSVFWALVSI